MILLRTNTVHVHLARSSDSAAVMLAHVQADHGLLNSCKLCTFAPSMSSFPACTGCTATKSRLRAKEGGGQGLAERGLAHPGGPTEAKP